MLGRAVIRCRRISPSLLHKRTFASATTIEEKNADLNALVFVPEAAESSMYHATGPMQGVSVAVKDNICTADMPTTCSSRMLGSFRSPFDATVVQLLRAAGASLVGKANCDEFGMGYLEAIQP